MGNFDYVTDREKEEIIPLLQELADVYPSEVKKGVERARKDQTTLKMSK